MRASTAAAAAQIIKIVRTILVPILRPWCNASRATVFTAVPMPMLPARDARIDPSASASSEAGSEAHTDEAQSVILMRERPVVSVA